MASPFDRLSSIKESRPDHRHLGTSENHQLGSNVHQQHNYQNDVSQQQYNKENSKQSSASNQSYVKNEETTLRRTYDPSRVATGIPGFEQMTNGGLLYNSVNLLTGGPGTGKTIFGLQYIINGIRMFNEPGVYISFDEQKSNVFENMKSVGMDLEKLEKEGLFHFVEYNPEQLMKILKEGGGLLDNLMTKSKAKRIVVDSVSTFLLMSSTDFGRREQLTGFFKLLKKWDVTAILTNENVPMSGTNISESLAIAFEVDSIIQLYFDNTKIGENAKRSIEIYKMRGSDHLKKAVPYEITSDGIRITS
ncbi:hypothetical protein H6503_03285 [Candidatus Woesearchaeota archaeon]|nr:hypothetical protein [Candidatus Woesearchaeota archaeon]